MKLLDFLCFLVGLTCILGNEYAIALSMDTWACKPIKSNFVIIMGTFRDGEKPRFLISMKIDGKDYQISGDCHLVEMRNSDDDCSESCDTKSCSTDAEYGPLHQKMWNKQDTKTLFDIRSKKEKEFNNDKVHKSFCEDITKESAAVGETSIATHCKNKWKALNRGYKKTEDNYAQTGSEKKLCPIFEQFGDLYGHISFTQIKVRQNNKTENKKSDDENDEDDEIEESRDSSPLDSCTPQLGSKPLNRRNNNQSSFLFPGEYTKRQEECRKDRLFERYGHNLLEFYDFTKNVEDYCKDLQMYFFPKPKATECFNSPFSYCSASPESPMKVWSCEMSTKCFTLNTLVRETCLNVDSDSYSSNIQIGNNLFVPTIEFHQMVTGSLEKWIDSI